MIQESFFDFASIPQFRSAKMAPISNRGPFLRRLRLIKILGADFVKNRFLNHFRYNLMRQIVLWFLSLPLFLNASSDLLFSEQEDPCIYHHVNVISGHLSLCFQDAEVPGAIPYSLTRTYSSSGALERNPQDTDSKLKAICDEWLIQGGWNFLPHTNLFMQVAMSVENYSFFLTEKNGGIMRYTFSKKKKGVHVFKPEMPAGQNLSNLSARMNPQNNRLHHDFDSEEAILYLSDGGVRVYKFKGKVSRGGKPVHFQLVKEVSPDKHEIHYEYDKNHYLTRIRSTGPGGKITFSSVDFNLIKKGNKRSHFHFSAKTSSNQELHYRSLTFKDRHYLADVESNCRPKESSHYVPGRATLGARMRSLMLGDKTQFNVYYYEPTKEQDKEWERHPEKKTFPIDKVCRLDAQMGPDGETVSLAEFSYFSDHTDVRDSDRILTRYHHDSKRILSIEYFDEHDLLCSSLRFFWEGPHLKAKVLVGADGAALFSKVFYYDKAGNVFQETFFGNLTGDAKGPFTLKKKGIFENAESYSKFYTYDAQHLLVKEVEERGVTYEYSYKPGTSLVTSKITSDDKGVLSREFSLYNENNLLTCEILDDGKSSAIEDVTDVTERHIKRYALHPSTGLITSLTETYLDAGAEKLLKRIEYKYSSQNRIISETLYDAAGSFCYTLHTDYDSFGHVISKTTPSGYKNVYRYNSQGELLSSKEEGALYQEYTYNLAGLPTSCTEIDSLGNRRVTLSKYDAKGRLLSRTSPEGNTTYQRYDPFGHCTETIFPDVKDEKGNAYKPSVHFSYDICGNLSSTLTPGGNTTHTLYNTFRKPIQIHQNESTTDHRYDIQGLLVETVYADGTSVHYTYDALHRKTTEEIFSCAGKILSRERWVYDAFHLLSYENSQGVVTLYHYDAAGRVVCEQIEDRATGYVYDSLGRLEKTIAGSLAQIEKHDPSGLVVAQWTEDSLGRQENLTAFLYVEGRKSQATRVTSQGDALDLFDYDSRGRLCCHTDPLGKRNEFLYEDVVNDLGQLVLQKTTVDPLLNRRIETYDALGHLVLEEKQNPSKERVAQTVYFYDASGNRARRVITVFDQTTPLRELTTEWRYDGDGHLVQEIEHPDKVTSYTYNLRGQTGSKTLPDGTQIFYDYDGLGRLIEQCSSDHTVHYRYHYENNSQPVRIDDLVHNTALKCSYNAFGELVNEISPLGAVTEWSYDTEGRCTELTLPDKSGIRYLYSGAHLGAVERIRSDGSSVYVHQYIDFDPNGHVTEERLIHKGGTLHTTRDLIERPVSQASGYLQHSTSYGPSGLVLSQNNSLLGNKTFAYDPLNQLIKEADTSHCFDSLGNPSHYVVNDHNQILSTPDTALHYDINGNPKERVTGDTTTIYEYDALGRLIRINDTTYTYDPLSRLLKKETPTTTTFYLYDGSQEIGTTSCSHKILELKVLGLGIQGDVGAAVAIELQGNVYAPLHDFSGHIIALISSDGSIFETYATDAFGKSTLETTSVNPWRFSSKRCEDHLIFFGCRFYDPELGRFLTPDPSPETDSPNLYLYVFNNPLNRLDLFGLNSDSLYAAPIFKPSSPLDNVSINIPLYLLPMQSNTRAIIPCRGHTGQAEDQYVVIFDAWHKLQFTPEEQKTGFVNIINHLHELVPKEGSMVGLITEINGINTSFKEIVQTGDFTTKNIPEGTLYIGRYNPTHGLIPDVWRFFKEKRGIETPQVAGFRQFMVAIGEIIHNINPNMLWMHLSHSAGSSVTSHAIDGMTPDQKAMMKQHLYAPAFGPGKPLSKEHTFFSKNIYSKKDHITKRFATDYLNQEGYSIDFIKCETPWYKRTMFFADHGIMGKTYKNAKNDEIKEARKTHKFYDSKTR